MFSLFTWKFLFVLKLDLVAEKDMHSTGGYGAPNKILIPLLALLLGDRLVGRLSG